jgi:hypothetical protein
MKAIHCKTQEHAPEISLGTVYTCAAYQTAAFNTSFATNASPLTVAHINSSASTACTTGLAVSAHKSVRDRLQHSSNAHTTPIPNLTHSADKLDD